MRTPNFITYLLTLGLLAAAPGHAADTAKKEGSFGKGGGAMLTKEQLRACLNQQARMSQQKDALVNEQAALAALKENIGRSGEALKVRLDTLDRTSADAVASYNELASARDKEIDDYEARVAVFNASVGAAQVEREAFLKGCENRRFLADDEVAIRKGK